jgi:hypothetical protein
MKKINVLLLLLLVNYYFAQSTVLYNLNNNRLLSNAINKIGINGMTDDEYQGSPYLEKQFLPSTIKDEKGTFLLRYNIYNDEIILKNGDEYFKIPKDGINYLVINNKYIIRLINGSYYIQSSSEKKNFVVVRKENIKFVPAKATDNSYGQNAQSKFSNGRPDFFLYDITTKKLILLNKEQIVSAFPDKKQELEQRLKKNKLKNIEDFNELLEIITK